VIAIIPAESANKTIPGKRLTFRWIYISLPVVVLLLSIILAACFYHLLPSEAAYHFKAGSPDRWMNRGTLIAWMMIPQFVFAVLGVIISGGATILSTRFQLEEITQVNKILSIMGNMLALPQLILTFAMLDIFLYNAYRIHLIPIWVFALIIMVLGSIVLGVFFVKALRQFRSLPGKNHQE
jgi:hypothetical protein